MSYTELSASSNFKAWRTATNENQRRARFINRVAVSGTYTCWSGDSAGVTEDYFSCSGTFTLTLPSAAHADAVAGRPIWIKNTGVGTITVARAGSDTIDGATSLSLTADQKALLVSNTTNEWDRLV